MAPAADLALDDLTTALAEELEDVSLDVAADVTGYERDGTTFARASAAIVDVRLPADIAEAALRTPDTSPMSGDADWVHFAPTTNEFHVVDRVQAWFHTAWRHAGEG